MFILSYGGLSFGYNEMLAWTRDVRTHYVERLLAQKKAESDAMDKKSGSKSPRSPKK